MAASLFHFAVVFVIGFAAAAARNENDNNNNMRDVRDRARDFLEGGDSSVRDAITNCTKSAAVCRDEAREQFKGDADMEGLSDKQREMAFLQVEEELGKDAAKERLSSCIQPGRSASESGKCASDAAASLRADLEKYVDQSKPADARERLLQGMEREAKEDLLREEFLQCLRSKSTTSERCAQETGEKMGPLGLDSMGRTELRGKAFEGLFTSSMKDCNETAPACRASAKAMAVASGMAEREFAMVKEMGAKRGGAEVWARCKDAGESDENCLEMTKEECEKLSGVSKGEFTVDFLNEVKRLGEAIRTGVRIVTMKRQKMLVNVLTNAGSCVSAVQIWFSKETGRRAMNSTDAAKNAVARACRLLSSKAEYRCSVDVDASDDAIAGLSEEIATSYEGDTLEQESRRLLLDETLDAEESQAGRRLSTTVVIESYASQEVVECAETDEACLGTPDTQTPGPVDSAPRAVAMGAVLFAQLLASLSIF